MIDAERKSANIARNRWERLEKEEDWAVSRFLTNFDYCGSRPSIRLNWFENIVDQCRPRSKVFFCFFCRWNWFENHVHTKRHELCDILKTFFHASPALEHFFHCLRLIAAFQSATRKNFSQNTCAELFEVSAKPFNLSPFLREDLSLHRLFSWTVHDLLEYIYIYIYKAGPQAVRGKPSIFNVHATEANPVVNVTPSDERRWWSLRTFEKFSNLSSWIPYALTIV